jgi:hypothetical protein
MKTVALLLGVTVLAGCASAPDYEAHRPDYCSTSQTIDVYNGNTVDSSTRIECTDNQVDRLVVKRAGIASNCGVYNYWTKRGGRDVQRQGISCQRPDGSWEILNTGNIAY